MHNDQTRRIHKREFLLQVLLPLVAGILVVAVLFYLVLTSTAANVERGAQIAVILLGLPIVAMGITLLVALWFLTSSINKLAKWLPQRSFQVQRVFEGINSGSKRASHLAIQPILTLESWGNSIKRLLSRRRW
jgi:predicted PurR-regulated permease PerM